MKKVNVRIVSSTNQRPERLVKEGSFRQDLYYRLAVLILEIPPLRERKRDIRLLTNYFAAKYNNMFGKEINGSPGNSVRSLRNVPCRATCGNWRTSSPTA